MHNFVVLGALAFAVASGIGQASDISSTGQWQENLARLSSVAAPYFTKDFRNFHARATGNASHFTD
jgi:hypothetical protein